MGRWGNDDRMDIYKVTDIHIRKNAKSVACICDRRSLRDNGDGTFIMDVRNYREEFSLSIVEPFHDQPISAGRLCTGFLVAPDIIATAGSVFGNRRLSDYFFLFGFELTAPGAVKVIFHKGNIYKGVEIIEENNNRETRSSWALIKLDRKVINRPIVKLAEKKVSLNTPVYTIGHPIGLPLKFGEGVIVGESSYAFFSTSLDIYQGNSGNPVFNSETHEVVGLITHGDTADFRWTEDGWISVQYPNPDYRSVEPKCTKISEFIGSIEGKQKAPLKLSKYYLNKNAQSNGDHEVHKFGCKYMPNENNRISLGSFSHSYEAIKRAREYFLAVNGGYNCLPDCATA